MKGESEQTRKKEKRQRFGLLGMVTRVMRKKNKKVQLKVGDCRDRVGQRREGGAITGSRL